MTAPISLRTIRRSDCPEITRQFAEQGWNKPESQYHAYCDFQESGTRDVLIAELDGAFAGYLTIQWESDYLPFRARKIPEIVDFNVLKKFQRQGIGTQLMDEAERRIKQRSDYAGIGFGVYEDYGAAQILYIKRGYVPDGRGLVKDSVAIQCGESITIDDSVVFCLTKRL